MVYRFIIFISIIQSILFLGHWFFYRTLVRFFGPFSPSMLLTLKIGLGLLSVSLVLTSFITFRYDHFLARFVYTMASSWLGILYLFILAAALTWILYGLSKGFRVPLNTKMLMEIFMGIALLASVYGFINSGMIRVTRVNVSLPSLPDHWKGKTVVWVSDTHLGHVRNHGFARKTAQLAEGFDPDILFIGGDLYDGSAVDLDHVIEPFSRISVPYGIYFITGNHEEFGDNTTYLQAVRRAGIRVLLNEKVDLDGLQILGVDYRDSLNKERFKTILQKAGIDRHQPSILLTHSPLHLEVAEEEGISLLLAGHTHHGQVFLFRWITSLVYDGYDYGLKGFKNLLVCTSSGAGTWGPPMRIDTKPEILVIKFN
jgi:predicted MPP superfamily phosphohydrolase